MSRNNFKNTVDAIKYRINYMNESPKYRNLVSDSDEYDDIPTDLFEAGEEDMPPDQKNIAPPAPNEIPSADPNAAPAPDPSMGEMPPADPNTPPATDPSMPPAPEDSMGSMPPPPIGESAPPTPDLQVDSIQNDIIKHNIAAMQDLNMQMQSLTDLANSLNGKLDTLAKDVEEVREPSDGEKLMNKGKVSEPYYLNLNDMWDKNWFNEKRDSLQEKGINKLDDGTYVADFDDLPKSSKTDLDNSFSQ